MVGGISLSGFSGLDTENIIHQLLEIDKVAITRLEARKTSHEETKDLWNNINTKLLSLRTSSEALLDRFNWQTVKANVSNPSVLSASTVAGAMEGSYRFEVETLGNPANLIGNTMNFEYEVFAEEIDETKKLKEFWPEFGVQTGSFIFKVDDNETQIEWNGSDDSIQDIVQRINNEVTDVNVTFVQTQDDDGNWKGRLQITSSSNVEIKDNDGNLMRKIYYNDGFQNPLNIHTSLRNVEGWDGLTGQSGSFKITVDGKETVINWDGNSDTVSNIINKINRSGAGVTAFYDERYENGYKGRLNFTSNSPGAFEIEIEDTSGNLMGNYFGVVDLGDPDAQSISGTNSVAKLNGVTINPRGNTYTVNGVTVNFSQEGTTSVNVTQDTDRILENVNNFISSYNEVQDYFDEVAKSDVGNRGPLAGNFLIQNIRSSLSSYLMSAYNWGAGSENTQLAAQLGITLGDFRTAEQNHLKLDEAKFLQAFRQDAQGVQNFFGYNKDAADPASGLKNAGLAYDFREHLRPVIQYRGLIHNERTSIDTLIETIDDRMEREFARIETREAQLRRQFGAMEQALQMLNSQSSYFESQLAQLNK